MAYVVPSEADGICSGGMRFSLLHNLCDTTQYGKKKKNSREHGHLAYLEILSGDHAIIRLQFFLRLSWFKSSKA